MIDYTPHSTIELLGKHPNSKASVVAFTTDANDIGGIYWFHTSALNLPHRFRLHYMRNGMPHPDTRNLLRRTTMKITAPVFRAKLVYDGARSHWRASKKICFLDYDQVMGAGEFQFTPISVTMGGIDEWIKGLFERKGITTQSIEMHNGVELSIIEGIFAFRSYGGRVGLIPYKLKPRQRLKPIEVL